MATRTPITAAMTADLITSFLPAQTLEIRAIMSIWSSASEWVVLELDGCCFVMT